MAMTMAKNWEGQPAFSAGGRSCLHRGWRLRAAGTGRAAERAHLQDPRPWMQRARVPLSPHCQAAEHMAPAAQGKQTAAPHPNTTARTVYRLCQLQGQGRGKGMCRNGPEHRTWCSSRCVAACLQYPKALPVQAIHSQRVQRAGTRRRRRQRVINSADDCALQQQHRPCMCRQGRLWVSAAQAAAHVLQLCNCFRVRRK